MWFVLELCHEDWRLGFHFPAPMLHQHFCSQIWTCVSPPTGNQDYIQIHQSFETKNQSWNTSNQWKTYTMTFLLLAKLQKLLFSCLQPSFGFGSNWKMWIAKGSFLLFRSFFQIWCLWTTILSWFWDCVIPMFCIREENSPYSFSIQDMKGDNQKSSEDQRETFYMTIGRFFDEIQANLSLWGVELPNI